MFEKLGKKIYDAVLRCGSTLKSKPRSRFRVATSLCPRTILVQFTVCGIGIAQGAPISKQFCEIFYRFSVQFLKNLASNFCTIYWPSIFRKICPSDLGEIFTQSHLQKSRDRFQIMNWWNELKSYRGFRENSEFEIRIS